MRPTRATLFRATNTNTAVIDASMRLRTVLSIWVLLTLAVAARATLVITPWMPIFKGIERAVGTNIPPTTIDAGGVIVTDNTRQVVHCVRVDLSDPDVQLFPTPPHTNYLAGTRETQTLSVSNFLKRHNLKVAINANFYWSFCCGGSDPSGEGQDAVAFGLLMSTGAVSSVPDSPPPGDSNPRGASWMFTTNKELTFAYNNYPPGVGTTGIYSAITGYYPVLTNGINIGDYASVNYPDPSFHSLQPRTSIGASADKRYLYLMTIDGRQGGYSDGALDREVAMWLLQFGASDGILMDGGGSTSMYMADCAGNPIALNHSSYIAGRNRERFVGGHLGISALPLESLFSNISASGGNTTAIVTWTTASNGTSQVEYGPTPSYGSLTALDSTLVSNHSVPLSGLTPGTLYYYRVRSRVGGTEYISGCGQSSFSTTNVGVTVTFGLTNNWKYDTASYDGVNWQSPGFDDSGWASGPAVMFAESRPSAPNAGLIPNYATGTRMPLSAATTYPYVTYYLRTRFVFPSSVAGATLTFSNYIDDGAVFYLNGVEIHRTNMPASPTIILNSTLANVSPCAGIGDAVCPMVFTLGGAALASSLVTGTNVLAVEVHNFSTTSPDITFEAALLAQVPPPSGPFITNIVVTPGETNVTINWTTMANSTSQLQYGLTPSLGNTTPFDSTLVTNHSVTVNGLQPTLTYYFRILSAVGSTTNSADGSFSTPAFFLPLVSFTNSWKFTTNNVSVAGWAEHYYDDSGWSGQGASLFYIENNPDVIPRTTQLPGGVSNAALPTYYFRAHFTFSNSVLGMALAFTNFLDDGAVFYLNGTEIKRVRMLTGPVAYSTLASDCPTNGCDATFETPDVFRIGGDLMTNVIVGDNLLAAEIHQVATNDSDVVFGSSVALVRALASETRLDIVRSNTVVCISWLGEFLTLQQATSLSAATVWTDVPGQIRRSPYCTTNPPAMRFYRLRN